MEVIGKIEEFRNEEHAIIRVIGIRDKKSSDWNTTESEIKKAISPAGLVFEPGFKRNFGFQLNDFIVFKVKLNPKADIKSMEKAHFQIDSRTNPKPSEYRLLELDHLLLNEFFIDLEHLNESVDDFPSKFYLKNGVKVYGPFKKDKNKIVPKSGKAVNIYDEIKFIQDGNTKIVLDPPKASKENIQAETDKQINTWLKVILKNIDSPLANVLKNNIAWKSEFKEINFQNSKIDKARFELAINNIENIDLTFLELTSIGNYSSKVNDIIKRKVDDCTKEIKDSLITELRQKTIENNAKIDEQLKKLKDLQEDISVLTNNRNNILKEINKCGVEYEHLKSDKERLIMDFQLYTSLNRAEPDRNKLSDSSSIIVDFVSQTTHQESLKLVKDIQNFLKSFNIKDTEEACKNNLFCFLTKNCILSESIEIVLAIIRAINNCKLKYINVEADWINNEKLNDSGYVNFFKEASDNTNLLYVLILRDINMSSPECYARRLMDFNNGLLPTLSADISTWPLNLKVVGTVLPYPEIGMPILKSNFNNWAGLNCNSLESTMRSDYSIDHGVTYKWLSENVSDEFENSIEDYFHEI